MRYWHAVLNWNHMSRILFVELMTVAPLDRDNCAKLLAICLATGLATMLVGNFYLPELMSRLSDNVSKMFAKF